jgi:hypothetical protein
MFAIGFGVGKLWPEPVKDLHNLTVWTQDKTPIE